MFRCIILENFHVFVRMGEGHPERRIEFTKSMLVAVDDIPEGHTADDWVAKGLAKAA